MSRTLIAGNWKMNGLRDGLSQIEAVAVAVGAGKEGVTALLCLPATLVALGAAATGHSALRIGGETCHPNEKGAHTGDISAEMLADAGASHVIVGHSERRADHGETDSVVASQAKAALRAGLVPIICVGESLAEREAGRTLERIESQLAGSIPAGIGASDFVIAYEPIWAIGTGKVASTEQIGEVHGAIRAWLASRFDAGASSTPILYGGSMNPGNAAEILAVTDVNGGLIGGASLKAEDFLSIYMSAI
ncbi:MAG: triose-phosphate isomerase [Alphaproteobacteria bacterium]|nr:triose-phosphate isomerase [Alphaproteobacteria bacterium]MBU2085376.1 triose-phosphate isomerase [Alphaproteobacteria bacterium]MBU2141885.1 triose-phosphate isomerase [Alphaproteobacteria bacterium]MBU2195743.1 triose-phosphate isomerase [Alphaproteobacteria bacterium]